MALHSFGESSALRPWGGRVSSAFHVGGDDGYALHGFTHDFCWLVLRYFCQLSSVFRPLGVGGWRLSFVLRPWRCPPSVRRGVHG